MTTQPADWADAASENVPYVADEPEWHARPSAGAWCDACVLVLPCGRSAHLEAGWASGAGKLTIGLLDDGEPDLMWKMLDALCTDVETVVELLDQRRETAFIEQTAAYTDPDVLADR